ncbi:MAG: DUF342 domain-containing protein [Enterovibrio sp.]
MLGELLQLSQDGNRVFAVAGATLREGQPKLTKNTFNQWLTDNGLEAFFCYDENIAQFIAEVNQENKAIAVNKDQENPQISEENPQKPPQGPRILAERRNAAVDVSFEDDELTAFLTVTGPYGGSQLKGSDLLFALNNALIVRGINKDMLRKLFRHSLQLKRGQRIKARVAQGQAATDGKNAELRYLVKDGRERILRPQMREDGTVDMRDLGKLIMVEEGQLLATYQPATSGVNGYTVTGKVIEAAAGEELTLTEFPGSTLSSQPQKIYASRSGIPILHPNGVEVEEALVLDGVTVATGHIEFNGSVVINGDIQPSMQVSATGSVTVSGIVESASITAGKDVIILNGIVGRQPADDEQYTATINAQGMVQVKFAQYAKIEAKGDIHILAYAIHCFTRTESNLLAVDRGGNSGTVTGGVHHVDGMVKASVIGASSGVLTQIQLFASFSDFVEQKRNLNMMLDIEEAGLKQATLMEKRLTLQSDKKRSELLFSYLEFVKENHTKKIADIEIKLRELNAEIDRALAARHIDIVKKCYSGLLCRIGMASYRTTDEHSNCRIFSNGFQIQMEPLKK